MIWMVHGNRKTSCMPTQIWASRTWTGPASCYQDKMIISLRKLLYEQRLKEGKRTTLEERRKRDDLLETHKIMHGLERIPEDNARFGENPRRYLLCKS